MRRPLARLTFAMWWKLLLLLYLFAFVRGFVGYVLPLGQFEFWLAAKLSLIPVLGDALWSTPGALPMALSAGEAVLDGLILFAALFGLLRFHIGRRHGDATLAWQVAAAGARDVFA